jgi:hypothetical protein
MKQEPIAWLYDNGKWTAETDQEKVWVESSDFTHDVRMYIDGDFEDLPQKFAYANEIAKRLNTAPRELSDEDVVIPRELAENYLQITEIPRYKRILEDALKKASEK